MKSRISYLLVLFLILNLPLQSNAQKSHGLEFNSQNYKRTPSRAFLVNSKNKELPESASLRQHCPKPLSQRMENTSPGWAAAYGARTIIEAQNLGLDSFDEIKRICYSPVFNYHLAKPDHAEDCSSPVQLPEVLESMKTHGTPRYIDFRKSCPTEVGEEIYRKAEEHKISDYFRIFNEDDNMNKKVDAVKQSLSNGSPVIIGMYSSPSFENVVDEFWQPRENIDREAHPGHAMVIVGYDDTKYTGAFEVMNSWGTDWGNEGFIWIRYKDFSEFATYGFELFVLDPASASTGILSGEVKIPMLDGNQMEFSLAIEDDGYYKTTMNYEDFTTFNLVIRSFGKSFVYVIGSDQTEEIYPIYPDLWISPAIPYSDHDLIITELGIDDTPGSNYLCILFSRRELTKSYILDQLNGYKGKDFKDKFFIAFYDSLIPADKIKFSSDKLKFEGTGSDKDLVGVIIEILH
jgi:hypothetical protein